MLSSWVLTEGQDAALSFGCSGRTLGSKLHISSWSLQAEDLLFKRSGHGPMAIRTVIQERLAQ